MNNAQSTSQKVVAWARPVYARPVNAPDTGEWDELVDIEFHTRPEKPEGEGWCPLVVADMGRQSTHSDDCWSWGPKHYECAVGKIERLQAEVERLRADLMESDEICEKLRRLLTRTATALKGEPPEDVWHSWHDLPEKAAQLAEALKKKVAQSLEWYAHGRCRGFDDEAPLPTNEAVELAERTLAKVRA